MINITEMTGHGVVSELPTVYNIFTTSRVLNAIPKRLSFSTSNTRDLGIL